MQMNETISCNFIDFGSVIINISSGWQFFPIELQEWYHIYLVIMQYLTLSPGGPIAPWGPGSPCRGDTQCSEHLS